MNPPPVSDSASDELRALFLEAAREILDEPDTPLDLRKVAERAGKSRTAPYLVFGKESEGGGLVALRIAVAAEGAREMWEAMAAAAAGRDDPLEAFHAVALAFLGFVERHPRLFRLMYGPEINAVKTIGSRAFREHPEFRRLLEYRDRAGEVVMELIRRGQDLGLLKADERHGARSAGEIEDVASVRFLQIAWASMIGTALLRQDELLRVIDWNLDRAQGARLITESVFGIDPEHARGAAALFLKAPGAEPGRPVPLMRRAPSAPALGFEPRRKSPPSESRAEAAGEDTAPAFFRVAEVQDVLPRYAESAAPGPDTLGHTLAAHSGLRRAAKARATLSGARILWIDDHPEWIEPVVETLQSLGAHVDVEANTAQALQRLVREGAPERRPYRILISDIARGRDPTAGLKAIPDLRRGTPGTPILFFVGDLDPSLGVPEGAAGITNRTDELLHLVLDALEGR